MHSVRRNIFEGSIVLSAFRLFSHEIRSEAKAPCGRGLAKLGGKKIRSQAGGVFSGGDLSYSRRGGTPTANPPSMGNAD